MKQFHYSAYGLTFTSAFEIRGLLECIGEQEEVILKMGKIDTSPFSIKKGFLIREMTPDGFLFCVENVAAFLISDGKHITIDAYTEDKGVWETLLLGPVMAALLQQNGFLTLHGSAFLFEEKAVLMLGATGVGKSSLAMALHKKGNCYLTDDICAITFSTEGEPLLYLGSSHVNLWEDSIEALGLSQNTSHQIRLGLSRHQFIMDLPRLNKCHPIKRVYLLEVGSIQDDILAAQKLDLMSSIKLLYKNIYGINSLRDMELENESFKMIHIMAAQITCSKLDRQHAQMDIKLVAEHLESFLKL